MGPPRSLSTTPYLSAALAAGRWLPSFLPSMLFTNASNCKTEFTIYNPGFKGFWENVMSSFPTSLIR